MAELHLVVFDGIHLISMIYHDIFSPCMSQSVMIWAIMSSAGVGLLCFLKSTVNAAIYQDIFRALHASFCWQALWRCWFSRKTWHLPTLIKVPKAGSMTMVLLCLIGWQTMIIYGVLSRGRRETPDPTMQMTWRPLTKQPGLLLHLSSATGWLPPCHATLMQ